VDIGSIPRALVERVEVTTGGASAVYGSDAVTGVVNFVLRDKFEGSQIDLRGGVSGEGDAENFSLDFLFGDNFADGRGNLVFALSIEEDSSITHGDRAWSRNNGIAVTQTNPAFLTDPNAPPRAVIDDARFWLTSQAGSIAPGGFTNASRTLNYGVDVNQNGIIDCQESTAGRNPFLAGCWITNPNGTVSVFKDGLVLNGLWSIGGMGGAWSYFDRDSLYPETDRVSVNINSGFELTDTTKLFFEAKYVKGTSSRFDEQDTYWDTLVIYPDNPFVPQQLLPVANRQGNLLLTKDPLDISDDNPDFFRRETIRVVAGVQFERTTASSPTRRRRPGCTSTVFSPPWMRSAVRTGRPSAAPISIRARTTRSTISPAMQASPTATISPTAITPSRRVTGSASRSIRSASMRRARKRRTSSPRSSSTSS
jgi:outer membrane receptor protein involved in Fe transport